MTHAMKLGKARINLPWIAVMGPDNAGKSSLIAQSGLQFAAIEPRGLTVSGVEGSDQYAWHYADEGVIVEMPYLTKSDTLKDLKHIMNGKSPAGVVLVLNLATSHTFEQTVSEMKHQLHHMVVLFKMKMPVHIVLTHTDTLSGFSSYVKALPALTREQHWGFLIHHPDEIGASFNTLYLRLCDLSIALMSLHTHPDEVTALIQFPQQFANLMHSVQPSLSTLMSQSPYYETPIYKSVLLTGRMGETSYFTKRLFKELIMKSWDTRESLRYQYQRRFLQCAGIISGILLCVMLLGLWLQNSRSETRQLPPPLFEGRIIAVYQPLIQKLITQYGTISVSDLLTADQAALFQNSNPLPAIFTKQAIRSKAMSAFRLAAYSEDKQQENAMVEALMQAYFEDYASAWQLFMRSVELKPVHEFEQMRAVNITLLSDDSPVEKILAFMIENLDIKSLGISHAELNADIKRLLSEVRPLWQSLNQELMSLAGTTDCAERCHLYAQKVMSSSQYTGLEEGVSDLKKILGTTRGDVGTWLEPLLISPFERAWELILNEAAHHVDELWQTEVFALYHKNIQGKFPFARTKTEAVLSDVIEFFRPSQGVLTLFINTHMQGYLTVKASTPEVNTWIGRGLPLTSTAMDQLSRGLNMGEVLWGAGGLEPVMTFHIAPVPMPGVEEIVFEHDGTLYRYRNEPEDWHTLTWPGTHTPLIAGLSIIRNGREDSAELQYEGPWSWFHLLEQAHITAVGGRQYDARWVLKTEQGVKVPINLKIRSDKQNSLLTPAQLEGFKLPESLISLKE